MTIIGAVDTPHGPATIHTGRYPKDGAIFIQLTSCRPDELGEPMATFSVNLKSYGCQLAFDEFNVKGWAENECLIAPLWETGLFEDTGRAFASCYVVSPIWRLRDPALVPMALNGKKGDAA